MCHLSPSTPISVLCVRWCSDVGKCVRELYTHTNRGVGRRGGWGWMQVRVRDKRWLSKKNKRTFHWNKCKQNTYMQDPAQWSLQCTICVKFDGQRFQVNGEFARAALWSHMMGGDVHTCALICSAVGGLILSHYCKAAAGATAPASARMSMLLLAQAGLVFHQGPGPPEHQKKALRKQNCCRWHLWNVLAFLSR